MNRSLKYDNSRTSAKQNQYMINLKVLQAIARAKSFVNTMSRRHMTNIFKKSCNNLWHTVPLKYVMASLLLLMPLAHATCDCHVSLYTTVCGLYIPVPCTGLWPNCEVYHWHLNVRRLPRVAAFSDWTLADTQKESSLIHNFLILSCLPHFRRMSKSSRLLLQHKVFPFHPFRCFQESFGHFHSVLALAATLLLWLRLSSK